MSMSRTLLSGDQIAKVRVPPEETSWLPNKAFTSPQVIDLKVDKIFTKTWISSGFEADIATVGADTKFVLHGDYHPDQHHFSVILELGNPQSPLSKTICQIITKRNT